jgi:hypothetical protein
MSIWPRYHAILCSRDALASHSNRSPWHASGAQKQTRSRPCKFVERAADDAGRAASVHTLR